MRVRVVAALVAALTVGGLASPVAASATPRRVTLAGSAPRWLSRAQRLGQAPGATSLNLRVYLSPAGGSDRLAAAVALVSTPGSPSYRRFISAAQFHATYDPTPDAVATVSTWLTSVGLRVTGRAEHNSYLTVTGTVAAARTAFGTSIDTYRHDGQTVQANSSALTMPTAVAAAVLAVGGLDTSAHVMTPSTPARGPRPPHQWTAPYPPPAAYANATPCSQYYGAQLASGLPAFGGRTLPYAVCGYTGTQLRSAYGVSSSSTDGSGVTVGIVDAYNSPSVLSDADNYARAHGDGAYAPGQYTSRSPIGYRNASECDPSGWFGEQSLDIEAVHAITPKAAIRYYAAASCTDEDFLDALAGVVDENAVQLVSNSWGGPDRSTTTATTDAYEKIFQQGALEGISFVFSSGDNGDEKATTGIAQTDYPASDPGVTAVGGTSTAIGSDGRIAFSAGWGTVQYRQNSTGNGWTSSGFAYGAGGGYSSLFARPAYQSAVVPSSAPTGRAVPDVAMDADPTTGLLIGLTQLYPDGTQAYGEYRIGGTSLAAPLFAGLTARLVQRVGRLGQLNSRIYGSARTSFTDVSGVPTDAGNVRVDYVNGLNSTSGVGYTVRTFGQDSSLTTAPGWDPVTGVGVPTAAWISGTSSAA